MSSKYLVYFCVLKNNLWKNTFVDKGEAERKGIWNKKRKK